MLFEFNFYSSFLLTFFIHGFVYGFLFFLRYARHRQHSARWLGFFLLLAALYVAPWMLGFAGWYIVQPYRDIMFYVPMQHLFLIGPVIFFYVSSLLNPGFRVAGKQWFHLLPGFLYIVFCMVMAFYDNVVVNDYYFLRREEDPEFDSWYQIAGCVSLAIYYISTLRYYNRYRNTVEAVISNAGAFLFNWVGNFLFALLFILLTWQALVITDIFYSLEFNISWWYYLSFSLCCYYIAIAGYSNSVESRIFFRSSFLPSNRVLYLRLDTHDAVREEKFEEVVIDTFIPPEKGDLDGNLLNWKARVESALVDGKLYQKADLNLFELAQALNTNASYISSVINRGFGCNFNDLINGYRVNRVVELLQQGRHKRHTLHTLALESGFNSKTTFNRAFRKKLRTSPQEYLRQQGL